MAEYRNIINNIV